MASLALRSLHRSSSTCPLPLFALFTFLALVTSPTPATARPLQCHDAMCVSLLAQTHFDISCRSENCFGCRWTTGGLEPSPDQLDFISCELVDIQDILHSPDEPLENFELIDTPVEPEARQRAPAAAAPWQDAPADAEYPSKSLDAEELRPEQLRLQVDATRGPSRGKGSRQTLFWKLATQPELGVTAGANQDDSLAGDSSLPTWLWSAVASVESVETRTALLLAAEDVLDDASLPIAQVKRRLEEIARTAKRAAKLEILEAMRAEEGDDWDGQDE